MKNFLSLKEILEGKKGGDEYYIQTYSLAHDIVDIIKISCKLIQKHGGHIYLGSDPGYIGDPFGLISKINIHFSNGFVLCLHPYSRTKNIYFESFLYFRKKKVEDYQEKNIITEYGKKRDYVFFQVSNIDYDEDKIEEVFYWYGVNSEIAKAPYGAHLLKVSTLESYAEYLASLDINDFKVSRKPYENYGLLTDKRKNPLVSFFKLDSKKDGDKLKDTLIKKNFASSKYNVFTEEEIVFYLDDYKKFPIKTETLNCFPKKVTTK